ncbi:hypothetical protein ACJYHF_005656, partial [Klebsiella pneumoniae]
STQQKFDLFNKAPSSGKDIVQIKNCDRYYDFPRPYPHFALSATRSVPQLSPPPYPPSRIVK